MTVSKQPPSTKSGRTTACREHYLQQQREITRSWLREHPQVGNWTILHDIDTVKSSKEKIKCQCVCGRILDVRVSDLKHGNTSRCKLCELKSRRTMNQATDLEYEKLYRRLGSIFKGIRQRCNNPHNKSYPHYGGRGIECRFESSKEFITYVSRLPYFSGSKLDRIDNEGHYEKGNLKWSTQKEQTRNTRRSVQLEGVNLATVAEKLNGTEFYASLRYNVSSGKIKTINEAEQHIEKNKKRRKTEQRIKALQKKRQDLSYETIRTFIKQGKTDKEIVAHKKWRGCGDYERN